MTVEDPVEFNIYGINQVQVHESIDLTFASVLRSFLRQDPNIILVGEIRDNETAAIAVKASLTGHLVLSTLHTNDAPSAISRLVDMDIDPYLVATSVILDRSPAPRQEDLHPLQGRGGDAAQGPSQPRLYRGRGRSPPRSAWGGAATNATTRDTRAASASMR